MFPSLGLDLLGLLLGNVVPGASTTDLAIGVHVV